MHRLLLPTIFLLVAVAACTPQATPAIERPSAVGTTAVPTPPVATREPLENEGLLSSGLSVADITENALPSIVQVIASTGAVAGSS